MKKFQAKLAALLGWAARATKDNQIFLSDDERTNLNTMLGEEKASTLIAQANAELT